MRTYIVIALVLVVFAVAIFFIDTAELPQTGVQNVTPTTQSAAKELFPTTTVKQLPDGTNSYEVSGYNIIQDAMLPPPSEISAKGLAMADRRNGGAASPRPTSAAPAPGRAIR